MIAIDNVPYRLQMAREKNGAITVNFDEVSSVPDVLKELTGGRGPHACIDAVGMKGNGHGLMFAYDRFRQMTKMQLNRIQRGELDPTFVITHRMKLDDAATGYDIFNQKFENCEKIVLSA